MKQKNIISTILLSAVVILTWTNFASAQVATGGTYSLDQSVIAGGGGQNSTGGNFALDGTIGQAVADTNGATGAPYKVQSGFFTPAPLAPTAASVSISGRLLTDNGRGLNNARVILTDSSGTTQTATSSSFGYYRFGDVSVGETYVISVVSKRYQFAPQVVFVTEENNSVNFTALGTVRF